MLASARVRTGAAAREQLRRLTSDDLNWELIWQITRRHGVAPLVFHTLTATGVMDPTDQRIAPFRERFLVNAANSLVLARELVELLALFAEIGVAAIPYKGPALAASLYGNIALREFSDLDVLVAPRDVPIVGEALLRRGYESETMLTPVQQQALLATRAGYFMRFDRPDRTGRIALELHWRIPSTFRFDEQLGNRLTAVKVLDREVPHFSPDDLLQLLCVHGFKHAWNQLKWICDVAELIEQPALDWELALDRARRSGGLRVVLLGCAMAWNTLGTEPPSRAAAAIARDPVVRTLAARLRRRLIDRPLPRVGVLNNIRIRERPADKVRYGVALVGHLLTPTVTERLSWPNWPGAPVLYTLLHPFRQAGRIARKHRLWKKGT